MGSRDRQVNDHRQRRLTSNEGAAGPGSRAGFASELVLSCSVVCSEWTGPPPGQPWTKA